MSSRKTGASSRRRGAAGLALLLGLAAVPAAPLAQTLHSADIRVELPAGTACRVSMDLSVRGAEMVEHRLALFEGDAVDLIEVGNAVPAAQARSGRTEVLAVRPPPDGGTYRLRYRVTLAPARAYRCPLWLPAAPADGVSRAVRLQVALPPGTVPSGDTLPAFDWRGHLGTATIGHVPAFVRVPYAAPGSGERPGWPLTRIMDAAAVAVFAAASGWWLWRRRR